MADIESDLQIDGKSVYSLRVIDLKQELKKRDIPFKTNATKAQLQTLLIEHLSQSIDTIEEDKLSEDNNSHTTEQSEDTNETIKSNSETNLNTVEENKPIAEQTEATDLSQDSGITSSVSFGDKQSIKLTIKLQPNDSPTKQLSPKKSPTKEMRSPLRLEEVRKDIDENLISIDSQVVDLTQISSEVKTKDLDQKEINSLESEPKEVTVFQISVEKEKEIKSIDSEPKEENEKQIEQEFNEKDNKIIDSKSEAKDEKVSQREEKSIEKEKSVELEAKDQSLDQIKEKSTENEIKSLDVEVNEKRVEQIDDKSIEKDNKSIELEVKDEKVSQKVEKTIEKEKPMESQPKEETTDPIKSTEKENKSIESKAKEEKVKPPRRRRWGSSVTTTDTQNARKGISSDQLKELIPDLNSSDNSSPALKVSKSDSIVVTSSLSRTQTTEENNEMPTKRDIRVVRKSVSVAEEEQTITEETTSQPIVEQKTKIVVEIEPESKGDAELKREVSPPRSAESNILFIRNLVRPFTLLQLKELLRKTGKLNVDRFWIDNIKSKCYATYETVEEAVATRTALHGTRWPSSNPKLLSVDFTTVEDLDSYLNPELNKESNNRRSDNDLNQKYDINVVRTEEQRNVLREKENKNESRPIREWDREKLVNKEDERKGRRRPNSPTNRSKSREQDTKRRKIGEERVRPADSTSEEAPPTAEAVKRTESPAKLLDDLFRKTSATPSIYWLPLTEEQAIARLAIREEEEKKRTEERNAREEQFRKRQEERRPFDGPSPPFRNERNQWRNDGPSNRGGFGGRRGSPRRSPFGGRRSPPRRRSPVNRFSRSRSRSPFARRKR